MSAAAPPRTLPDALVVAAEHHAFCPDNVWQGSGSLDAYAKELLLADHWDESLRSLATPCFWARRPATVPAPLVSGFSTLQVTNPTGCLAATAVSCTEICGVPDARVTVLAKENHQHHGSTP
ncbi:DUF4253 domain-containing protein [Streptomyces sp. MUM 203J]|uniref:DUF4253 domain-containing protein n=1 Tax=Streptomyces sp. MUM 203J TaxID=2791990 RepID=UPI0027E52DE2|nr:DUF4253 domain-containing protein [Streptomyces sp. MUM 203J]MCH0539164.1 DUF4253 domain-containing protein [Streptomyces sp. MUM 203J]